jgi:2-alkyl-3-oxoalkanoate reductase
MSEFKVLVTGASGMVGSHVCQFLVASGIEVTGMVRKTSSIDQLESMCGSGAFKIAYGDLSDPENLRSVVQGHDVVVHAAGIVDPLGSRERIYATNVEGTGHVLEAAIKAGCTQFVFISSLSVITGKRDQFNVNEEAPLRYCGESYADSKVDAERLVMSKSGQGSISVTSLRPGFIYGPGERAWMPRLIGNLKAGKAMLIDGGTKETNIIYIENLCRAVASSLMNKEACGQVYNLTDGQQVTKKQLFDAICDGMDIPRVKRTVPGFAARIVCEIVSTFAPCLGVETQRKLSRFSRAAFRLAGVNQGFDISKAEKELNYVIRVAFAEGMAETLKAFREDGINAGKDAPSQSELVEGRR